MYVSKQTTFVSLATLATGVSLGYAISNSPATDPVPSNAENVPPPSSYEKETGSKATISQTQQEISEIPIPEVPEMEDLNHKFEWQQSLERQLGGKPWQQAAADTEASSWSQPFFGRAAKTSFESAVGLSESATTTPARETTPIAQARRQTESANRDSESGTSETATSPSARTSQQVGIRSQPTNLAPGNRDSESGTSETATSPSVRTSQQVGIRSQPTNLAPGNRDSESGTSETATSPSVRTSQQVGIRSQPTNLAPRNNSHSPQVRAVTNADVVTQQAVPTAPQTSESQPPQLARSLVGENSSNSNRDRWQVATNPRSYPSRGTAADLQRPQQTSLQMVVASNNTNKTGDGGEGTGIPEHRASNTETASQPAEVVAPNREQISSVRSQLDQIAVPSEVSDQRRGASPGLTIAVPSGFGADRNTLYTSATYQSETRFSDQEDGAAAIGFGFGNADEAVGVELSYTVASFGNNRDFGSGGFNLKVHRRLPGDWSVAAGWNGFLNLGDGNDFEDSLYGSASKVFRLKDDINKPFSRVAVTAGIGNGQFRTEEAVDEDEEGVNPFGSVSVRVARPVSAIVEWTGQDLSLGASVTPFKNVPITITPAVRDVTGAGDEARFVLGIGMGYQF